MIILILSCVHCDPPEFVLCMIFVVSLYDGGARSKTLCRVSSFFIQAGNWNVFLEFRCLKTFLKYVSYVFFIKIGLTSSFFRMFLCNNPKSYHFVKSRLFVVFFPSKFSSYQL